MPERVRFLVLLCGFVPGVLLAQAQRSDAAREAFLAAWSRAGAPVQEEDSAQLRRYLLYPYLQAERLRAALGAVAAGRRDEAVDGRVRAFLKQHAGQPVTWNLERAWLEYLARRGAWSEFVAEAPDALNDSSLKCHALAARIALDDLDGLREAALALWLSPASRSSACDPVFRWLDTRQRLSDEDIEARARFAIAGRQDLPKMLGSLPEEKRAVLQVWDRLMARPGRNLVRFLDGENLLAPEKRTKVPPQDYNEALLEAFDLLARRDSREAGRVFPRLRKHPGFGDAEEGRLRRSYALGLAYDHRAEAVDEFARVPDEALDVLAYQWRVRSALLHGEFRRAHKWLETMPEELRREPRWQYWLGRVHELRRDREEARHFYGEAAKEREYYAFLAAERLGQAPELRPVRLPNDGATLDLLAATPAMLRALELFRAEQTDLAMSEFRFALRELPDSTRAQGARLADAWGWHHAAVLLLSELKLWDDLWLRFPLPHEKDVDAAAKDTGLPPEWIHSIIRTESLYHRRAVSSARAMGLMQVLLPTARQVAQRAKLPVPSADDLFRPDVNIALGARYLRELQGRFGDRFVLTLAAYNAGPQRLPGWLPPGGVEADIWIENIPYNETRDYVQRALYTFVIVGWRRTGEPARLLPLLPPIEAPRKDGRK